MAVTVFISIYTTRLILGSLGVADFGIYGLIGGVIAMLGFLNNSMASATQRFISLAQGVGDIEKIRLIFNMSTLLHITIALIVVLFLEIAGYFLFNGILNIPESRIATAKLVYQFMIISTFFSVTSVPYEAILTSHENMFFYAITGVIESIIKLIIALYLSYGDNSLPTGFFISMDKIGFTYSIFDKLIIYSILTASLTIFILFINRVYCHSKYPECQINFKKNYNKNLLREMSGFASWCFLGSASSMISQYGQGLMLNYFFGTKVNAAQAITNQVSGQLSTFATTMTKALNPMIVKTEGSGNRELALQAAYLGSKVGFFLLMILYIPILVEMPYVFKIWLKEIPEYTFIFCKLLLTQILINQMFYTLTVTISAVGNISLYQTITSILQILTLIVTFFLFKLGFPPYTIYFTFIIYSLILSIIIVIFSKKYCELPVNIFLKDVVSRCVLSFVFVYSLTYTPLFFIEESINRFIFVLITFGISLPLIIWLVGLTQNEKLALLKILKQLFNKTNDNTSINFK